MNKNSKSVDQFFKGRNPNRITSLDLSGEELTAIPSIIFKCRNLKKLNISNNRLSSIPKEIQTLRKLKVLNVSHNMLTQIPAPVCRLLKLRVLDISHNQIKVLPKQLADSHITTLIANNNKIEVVKSSLLIGIERLIISNNNIAVFCPDSPLPNLKYVWITNNPCTSENVLITNRNMFPGVKKSYPCISDNKTIKQIASEKSNTIDMNKNKIFISYAHADQKWLDLIRTNLNSLKHIVGGFDYWDDDRIRTGDKWKQEIEKALQSAGAAILIITPNFLASDFISNNELPPILAKAQEEGTHIFPVIARKSLFSRSPLSEFQAVNPPEKPLNACSDAEVDEYLYRLMDDIIIKLGLDNKTI